jgi:hypothetical protein
MSMDHAALDVWFKEQAATQLDTFDKTVTITATVYLQGSGTNPPSAQGTVANTVNWSLGYETATFDSDLAAGIGAGQIAKSQDVATSVSNAVRSAVDRIEAIMVNKSITALLCHSSCHTSCHASRGRR